MRNFCFALCIALIVYVNQAFGSEAGMPQLNPEFWASQTFWLILIFSTLYLIIWKIFLPKITYSIENRKFRIVNNLDEAQKLKENAEKKLNEYNKIIEESKKEAKKLIKFCGLAWDKKCLEFYKRKDLISKTTSNVQIRMAIYKHSLDKYLPYKQFLDKYGKRYSWFN